MTNQEELRRLRERPGSSLPPPQMMMVWFVAQCQGQANAVLEKTREVLEAVLSQDPAHYPTTEVWRLILPPWFIAQCAEEIPQQEAERRLRLPLEERLGLGQRWSVGGWVYWFQPSERYWFWWDAVVEDQNTLRIGVVVNELPFPYGALEWLLKTSGATGMEED